MNHYEDKVKVIYKKGMKVIKWWVYLICIRKKKYHSKSFLLFVPFDLMLNQLLKPIFGEKLFLCWEVSLDTSW